MKHFIIKFVVGSLLGLAVTFLLAFNALLLWVATGPRSLNAVSPYIEMALTPTGNNYSVKIEETWLIWDGWKHPIDIRLRNVIILNHDKQRVSAFPEISLGLDLLSLAEGRLFPSSLTLTHPELSLYQNDDGSIDFGLQKEAPAASPVADATAPAPAPEEVTEVPLAAVLAPLISPDQSSNLRDLHMVTIVNGTISIHNPHKGIFFKATDAQLVFKSNRRGLNTYGSATISYDKYNSMLSAQFTLPKDSDVMEGTFSFNEIMPGILADLFANNTELSAMKLPLSGEGKVSMDRKGVLQRLDFAVNGGKGTIETNRLDGPLAVTALHAEGSLGNNGSDLTLTKLNANLGGMLLDADGSASFAKDATAIGGNVFLKNVPAGNIHAIWPPTLAPETREWIIKNITDGRISKAEAHFNIAPGDLAKAELPKTDIDATIHIEDNTVRYLPEHPPLTNVRGHVHLDGTSLNATIDSAQFMKQTKMSNGTVEIDDLNVDNPYIKVAFDTETSVKDVVRFLDLPRLKHAKRLNLNPETADGSVKGHAAVGFLFFTPKDDEHKKDDDISYDVKAEVKNATQPGFMQKFDISGAAGMVVVSNDLVEFKGTGNVNGATISDSDVKYLFKPDAKNKNVDTLIDVTATAPVESLPRFGYPAFPFLKGNLGIKANLKEGDGGELAQASIDLTNTIINWQQIEWKKPDKEPASIELTSQKKNGVATFPSFSVKGKGINVHGSAELTQDLSDIQRVSADKFIYLGSDLDRMEYEKIDGGFKLDARGNTSDISAWMQGGDESTFSFEHFPAAIVNIDFKQVISGKNRALNGVKGTLNCTVKLCENAAIAGTTADNKPFQFRILRNPKGARQLSLHAKNAGAFLKGVGIFDSMEGGDLTVTGNYDDSGDHSILRGAADIDAHTIHDAPVLARMLSLASLTGFFDTLRGKGIAFAKLHAPFTLSKDVITLKDAKTHGDAMGMTMEGTITFPKRTLDLQGTIVPSYTLNNVLGNVPLVGHMLTGGEGQGVFAARYTMKGTDSAPDVSVNPLSILTPGFLRGLFDIFDTPKKSDDE